MTFTLSRTVFISFICTLVLSSCAHTPLPSFYGELAQEEVFKGQGHPRTVTIKSFSLDTKDSTFLYAKHKEYDQDGHLLFQMDEFPDERGIIVKTIINQNFSDDGALSHMEAIISNPDNPLLFDTMGIIDYSILYKNKEMIVVRSKGTGLMTCDQIDTILFDYKVRTVVTNGFKVEKYNKNGLLIELSFKNYSQDEFTDPYYMPTYFKYDRRGNLIRREHFYQETYSYLSFDKERNWTKRIYHGDFCVRNLEIAEYEYW